LTLNPLKYSHPVLSILLPVVFIAMGGIGLPGGAVYVHPHRFRTDLQRALVSLSGPLVNAGCAVILLVVARHNLLTSPHTAFWIAVAFLGLLQITATILNLLPVPGLDGYGAIEPYLDSKFRQGAEQFKPFGMLAVFALLQVRSINQAFFDAVYWLFELSGLPRVVASEGFALVQFWHAS
jgi:Zn-dependent protease